MSMSSSENESYSSVAPTAIPVAQQPPRDDGSGSVPRKRVSQACAPCARRKTKCDGELPTCGQCRQRDIQDCIYTTSRRNKRARRSSPYPFQRASLGFEDHGMMYPAAESSNHQTLNPPFNQEAAPQVLAPMENFITPNSRAPLPSNTIIPRILSSQPPGLLPHVSARLLKDYFATIHPMWPILYKPMYDLTAYDDLHRMPSPLLFAIFSIAACIQPQSPDDIPFDMPIPSQLFESSLMLLQRPANGNTSALHPLHLLKPSIESCQTLTILALQQHGVAESHSAALLLGLAASMATELRLHRAMGPGADPMEVQIRARLWWNIYVLDKMMACEMKRPVLLRSEENDTPFPSTSEADEFQLLSLKAAGQNRFTSVKTHTISGFHTTIQIVMIMEKISREIYSIHGRQAIRDNSDSIEESRMRLWQELKDYHTMLDSSPLGLDLHGGVVPAPVTITNMVWMYCGTILLHRPFAAQQDKLVDKRYRNTLRPLDICFVASNNICDILEGYADNLPRLSCDMIFPIFTTASTLSHCSKQVDREDRLTQQRIDMCVRWLLILGKSWKNAGARQQMLAKDLRPSSTPLPNRTATPLITDSRNPTPLGSSTPIPLHSNDNQNLNPHDNGNGNGNGNNNNDDWAFLDNFGDATDDFYSMDTSFREMLQGHFESAGHGPATGFKPEH